MKIIKRVNLRCIKHVFLEKLAEILAFIDPHLQKETH